MNKARRKAIQDVIAKLETLRDEVESLLNDEQDYYDNMPESFQNGDKGSAASDAISYMESASGYIDNAIEELGCATE
jgi:uncharacterized coiled-coil DUF342 family protein